MKQVMKYAGLIAIVALFVQCSKKTASVITDAPQDVQNIVDQSFRKNAPVAGPAPKINIGEAETFKLDNGLQVILVENHKIPQVSFQITLKNDPFPEGDQVGYVAMAGDLMGRGTTTKTKAEIDEAVDFIGASLSTFSTGLFASSLTKHTDALMEIVSDVLYNPSFPPEELEKIKKQTISGIESSKTDPNAIAGNLRAKILYGPKHPYGEVQTKEHVDNITLASCKDYYERFFIPNNAYLIIVGAVSTEDAKILANRYFSKWQPKPFKPVGKMDVAMQDTRQVHFSNKDGAVQSVINISYPVNLKPGEPDVVKASVTNTILGGGFSSRLMQNLREDKAYTYGARSSLSSDPLIGSFTASASVRNEVTDSSITQFLYEMERMTMEDVGEQELQSIKNYMTGSFARSLESPQTIARFALNKFRYNLPDDYYETYLERLNAVTIEDVKMMAAKYIRPDKANIIVVGNKDEVAEKLTAFDQDGEIDFYNPFGDKIDLNALAIPKGLTAQNVIEAYLSAIGGKEKLKALRTVYSKMNSEIMGQTLVIETYQKSPDKFAMSVGNGVMVFQEQVYNGKKVMQSQMGQKQVFTEGPQFDAVKGQAVIIPQLLYANDYSIELSGVEDLEGTKTYKLSVTDPRGDKTTEYYDVESSLLVRMVSSQETPNGPVTITTDFGEYEEAGGVLFPTYSKISGVMPQPMEARIAEIKVNEDIPDTKFVIE